VTEHDDLLARRRAVMPDWLATSYQHPIALDHGQGSYVWDVEGNRYLDFFGGILTTMCGHNLPEVVEAITAQAAKILHTSTLYLHRATIELAETIAELSGIPDAKVFFTTSGTEANDAALLLATSYRRSNQVIALRNSYHGRSFSTVAVTGHRSWSPTSVSGLSVNYVHGGYRLRSPFAHLDDTAYNQACVDDLHQVIDMMTAGDVAAFIAEPIQGVGGVAVPPPGFFAAMKTVLDEHGILFIADEVQTGWGRTGETFWGHQADGVVPDLFTFAKGVGNGIALGGVVGRAEVMDHLQANSISTFGGNPLASVAASATIRYVLEHGLQANAASMGVRLGDGLRRASIGRPEVAEVRGKGLMWAIEIVEPGGIRPDPERAAAIHEVTRQAGLLVGRGGLYGNVLRIAPPLNVRPLEIDEGLDILSSAISTC
jgi:4-aminobutyrate aminotransferase